mmetsp:Transcript_19539/g.64610  ORF Transcript_19539/g.64610 Transcript_19539/m.64610 type:complete len:144 (-) Transcript_19539:576-1007(-)
MSDAGGVGDSEQSEAESELGTLDAEADAAAAVEEEELLTKLDESRLARWRDDPRRGFGLRRLLPHDGSPAHATTLVVSSRSPRALSAARTTLAAASAGVAAARTCFATRSSERASQTPSEQAMTFAPPGRSNARVHTLGVGST